MLGKIVLLGSAVAASLLLASSAQAEGRCPDGYYPTGGGTAGWLGCAPMSPIPRGDNSNSEPDDRPRISTMYANSYIAVAWHPEASDVWATWNHWTREKSQQAALTACTQVMGSGCTIAVSGWNGSVAIARDKRNLLWYGWGNKPDNARTNLLTVCKDKNEDCKIAHVFTAEPLRHPANFTPMQKKILETNPAFNVSKNYFPDRSVPRIKPVATAKPDKPK
ncbi:DUF4189 domain-containing protein [Chamaesiphon polymorphus]|nr:DUF4189 domain-containing protein [Chamaesiphon polymorphus]